MTTRIPRDPQDEAALIPHELKVRLIHGYALAQEQGNHVLVTTVKLFDPHSRWTFYAFEGYEREDGEFAIYGFLHAGGVAEWNTFTLKELESRRSCLGAPMQRDKDFRYVTRSAIERGERP